MSRQWENSRYQAMTEARNRAPRTPTGPSRPVSEIYGELVLTMDKLKARMAVADFARLVAVVEQHEKLTADVAAATARVAFAWASELGATHFCHWFQPQTGVTAEKHDSFLNFEGSKAIFELSGSQLLQSEPDASSFPSGGLRATHTARGYTCWDPASPMFVADIDGARTLYIPSVFVSYTGEALDERLGLLRSSEVLSREALELLSILGEHGARRIETTLGTEQEYFLVDRAYYSLRPDLQMCGRTLLGNKPPRGQQLEDHYFGVIPPRVQAFMAEAEQELYRLGVPVKTRHNEVAPAQFETAPIFENADLAADHNQLTMSVLQRVGERHGFKVLFHEKPFAGLNGNGKHCNWSMAVSETGPGFSGSRNLLEPGTTPADNVRFLAFLTAVIRGVDQHAGLLRAGIASHSNDHRLGANEAPPAILSIFLGDTLTKIVSAIVREERFGDGDGTGAIALGVAKLADVKKDNTDRNRTSPFAFTGNKFEFRAVGGSAAVAFPVTLLNAAVASGLREVTARLRRLGTDKPTAAQTISVLAGLLKESMRVCFDGNGYSQEWQEEADRRGLLNLRQTPEALEQLETKTAQELLGEFRVFAPAELKSRHHVRLELYVKKARIEADVLSQMVATMIVPAVGDYVAQLLTTASTAKQLSLASPHAKLAQEVSERYEALLAAQSAFEDKRAKAHSISDEARAARFIADELQVEMERLRELCDALEVTVDDRLWPLPKYREMLFVF